MPEYTSYIDSIAERQALRVLSLMGPYSVTKLLEALEDGKVDGGYYDETTTDRPYDNRTYHYTDEKDGPIAFEEFKGCFMGWAGFLENLPHSTLWGRLQEKFGSRRGELDTEERENTDELERFVSGIRLGSTPETNIHAATLKELILAFQAGEVTAIAVQSDELLENDDDDEGDYFGDDDDEDDEEEVEPF